MLVKIKFLFDLKCVKIMRPEYVYYNTFNTDFNWFGIVLARNIVFAIGKEKASSAGKEYRFCESQFRCLVYLKLSTIIL